MSDMTDEEKAKLVSEGVDEQGKTSQDEPEDNQQAGNEEVDNDNNAQSDGADEGTAEGEGEEEQAPPADEGKNSEEDKGQAKAPSFERKFQNIKGEDPAEYAKNLETAYENSTSEAVRLNKELKDAAELIRQAKEIVEGGKGKDPNKSQEFSVQEAIDNHPIIRQQKERQLKDLTDEFNKFRGRVPDVNLDDPENFKKFEGVVEKAGDALRIATGEEPTYAEMFDKAATLLGWDAQDKVGEAVKGVAASTKTNSGKKTVPKSTITDKEVAVAKRFFPGLSETDIRKELEKNKV